MQLARLTSSCCHSISAWGLPLAAGVLLGSIKELTLPPTHTPPNAVLEGRLAHLIPQLHHTLSSVCSAVARDPTRWIVGTHSGYLLHNALFIGCLWLRAFLPQALSALMFPAVTSTCTCLKVCFWGTKLQQLAEFSASRTSPLSNGCWLCIHKGCLRS